MCNLGPQPRPGHGCRGSRHSARQVGTPSALALSAVYRRAVVLAAAVVFVLLIAAWTQTGAPRPTTVAPDPNRSTAPTAHVTTTSRAPAHDDFDGVATLTALGDSVPAGTACHCTPFPDLAGSDLARRTAHRVVTTNLSVGGITSGDVLQQLREDDDVKAAARGSDAFIVEVGANDVSYTGACGTTVSCYDRGIANLSGTLTAIVARLHDLARRHDDTPIVMVDYWNVWLGGQYAVAQGPAYVAAANTLTDRVDSIIKTVAERTGSFYVDLRTAFRGPDNAWDETHLLASDGDHPNADGHRRIADAIARAVVSR